MNWAVRRVSGHIYAIDVLKRNPYLANIHVTQICTVRWSNFDHRDSGRSMGVFLQSTEATPCGHLLK